MENQEEKIEALKVLAEFNGRLIKNMKSLIIELTEGRREDTDQLLNDVLNAINWEISIMGATMDVLNKDKERIRKEGFNEKITILAEALQEKKDEKIAEAMQGLVIQFEVLGEVARKIIK